MKVLLVEPDLQLGQIYTQALRAAGHSVSLQRQAQTAIEEADKFMPDLIILELKLARHNGVEFLYEFRSYPDWQDIPVVLNTSVNKLPASQNLLNRLGVRAVYYKPQMKLKHLLDCVEQFTTANI